MNSVDHGVRSATAGVLVGIFVGILSGANIAAAQESPVTIRGRVIESGGSPLSRVSIRTGAREKVTRTDSTGRFRVTLASGRQRLQLSRLGYAMLDTTIRIVEGDSLVLTMRRQPTALPGIVVTDDDAPPMTAVMKVANTRQPPALGEADVLRLLPLLPGVTQSNDIVSRVHVMGGAGDEMQIRLDGFPLQYPQHLGGVVGAFNVAALDRAELKAMHLPSDIDGVVSGVLDVHTRATGAAHREVVWSLLSTSLTVSQPRAVGGVDVLVSGRASYADVVTRALRRRTGASDDWLLPGFRDGLLKLSRRWQHGWQAELLTYGTYDIAGSDERDDGQPPEGAEGLVGLRLLKVGRSSQYAWALSNSMARTRSERLRGESDPFGANLGSFTNLMQRWTTIAFDGTRTWSRTRLHAGARLDARTHEHSWRNAESSIGVSQPFALDIRASQRRVGTFVELAFQPTARLSITTGAHASSVGGRTWIAPRLQATAQMPQGLAVSAALDRRLQFDYQLRDPSTPAFLQPTFLSGQPRVANVASLSATHRVRTNGRRQLLELAAFFKQTDNRPTLATVRTPTRDTRVVTALPLVSIDGHAYGVNATADVTYANGSSVRASYSWQTIRESDSLGVATPAAWDTPHTFSGYIATPRMAGWRLTATAVLRSGLPVPPRRSDVPIIVVVGDATRGNAYRRFDVGARREFMARGAEWAFLLQVVNVTGRANQNRGTAEYLPIIPSLGLEIRW